MRTLIISWVLNNFFCIKVKYLQKMKPVIFKIKPVGGFEAKKASTCKDWK
jgi:hypothetical protein